MSFDLDFKSLVYIRPMKTGSSSVLDLLSTFINDALINRKLRDQRQASTNSPIRIIDRMRARGAWDDENGSVHGFNEYDEIIRFALCAQLGVNERSDMHLEHWPFMFDRQFFGNTMRNEPVYISMLREPLPWYLSHFNTDFYSTSREKATPEDFECWLNERDHVKEHRKYACWYTGYDEASTVDNAISNLSRIHVLGVTERHGAFCDMLARETGVKQDTTSPSSNVSAKKYDGRTLEISEIPNDIIKKVARMTEGDKEIYEAAKKISA